MKKIYFLFLLVLLPLVASADTVEIDGVSYELYYDIVDEEIYGRYAEVVGNNCSGDVVIPETVTWEGVDYPVTTICSDAFSNNMDITSVTIPNGIEIYDQAFYNCSGLTSVVIGNSSIYNQAFYNCSGLTSVVIGDGSTDAEFYIGEQAFSTCTSLASLTLGNGLTSISDQAFEHCYSLKSLTIPKMLTFISETAFIGCAGLETIQVDPENPYYDSRDNCNAIIQREPYEMPILRLGCKNTTIPKSVVSIGVYAFYGCSSLTAIDIPNNVEIIESYAFAFCANATTIGIGTGVYDIGEGAFGCCYNVTDVYCFGEGAPWTPNVEENYESIFNNTPISSATLHIPAGCQESYSTEPWSGFGTVVEITSADVKVSLNKTKATIEQGKTLTLKPTFNPSTFPNKAVSWNSSNTSVATVSSDGIVTGVGAGTAKITCVAMTGSYATCKVTVGYVSLDKTEAVVEKTKTLTLTPTVYPSSLTDKSVTWKSSKTSVATVSSDGVVTGVKAGTATITCTSNATGLSTTCQVTVGYVKLDMTEVTIAKGKTTTLTPTVYPSALTDKSVTWESSNTKVATVTSAGKVKGVKAGTATITCTSNVTGLSTTCQVTVVGVSLSKSEAVIEKTKTLTLKATVSPSTFTDKSVTWESSNTKVATVSSSGKVTGVKAGTATITCTSTATGASATCQVTVGYVKLDKTEAAIKKGTTMTLTATVYPSSLTDKKVTWKSSDTEVATVTSSGKVKGVKYGTATITCTSNATGLSTTCTVTVGKVILNKTVLSVKKGTTLPLTATVYPSTLTDQSVTWESSNTKVATVTADGKVNGVKAGTATITCTSNATGLSATCKVTVGYVKLDQTEVTVKKGKTVTLKATVYPSSLSDKSVIWESSNTSIATVTSSGKIKGVSAGIAIITCTSYATGLSTVCLVTVTTTSTSRSVGGDDDDTTDIETIENAPAAISPFDVYDLSGRKVLNQTTSLDGLPDGIYIVNGKKVLKK